MDARVIKEYEEMVFLAAEESIVKAVKTMREKFSLCKTLFTKKQMHAQHLYEHNRRLTNAMELLKRENAELKTHLQKESPSPSADDLDIAFESEQMFNSSADANDYVIAETQRNGNARALRDHNSILTPENSKPLKAKSYKPKSRHSRSQLKKFSKPIKMVNYDTQAISRAESVYGNLLDGKSTKVSQLLSPCNLSRPMQNPNLKYEEDADAESSGELRVENREFTDDELQLVSPSPPQIVFLDNSSSEDGDITQLKTLDLLKVDSGVLGNVEKKCIQQAKNQNEHVFVPPMPVNQDNAELEYTRQIEQWYEPIKKEIIASASQLQEDVHMEENCISSTPENFWNPLLASFDQNDPRREVLRDGRLKKTKFAV